MSTSRVAFPYPAQAGEKTRLQQLWETFQRYTPSQGWAMFVLLLAALFVVGDSVSEADWVDTPGLQFVLASSALAGLLLAKVRLPWFLLMLFGIAIGFVVVVWQTSSLIEGQPLNDQVRILWNRTSNWWQAATGGGISNDLIPLSLGILSASWILGFFSSWFIFRRNNVWIGVVLMATAILTNLSFLPDRFSSRFFLFMLFALLLVVRMTVVLDQEKWKKAGVQFSIVSGWLTMHAAVWISIVVLILSAILPMKAVVSRPLADVWKLARSPVENVEDDFARLLGGVPSRKNTPGRLFGKSLPFLGSISFDGEVVFLADTNYPSYWLSRTYDRYTSQGWIAGDVTEIEVGPEALVPPRSDSFKRIRVDQAVQLNFDSDEFLVGGSLDWVSREGSVGVLAPKKFVVDLYNPAPDSALPADIQELALELREVLIPEPAFVESVISRILPNDLVLNKVSYASDEFDNKERLVRVHLERKAPIAPDIVTYNFSDEVRENEIYAITSFVSVATDEDLRKADTDYSSFITDHYLQLPSTLPQRVRDLAIELTADADNPLDKALAIQSYLRDDNRFTYSQDIDAPPSTADGVDYFLFESKTGYSDYFGSSMTVLLRAAGVPARMAAGYAPGEFDQEIDRRVVRDFDSHGWVQAYFPNFGWIDFEPTPRWPLPQRSLLNSQDFNQLPDRLNAPSGLDDPEDTFDPSIEQIGQGEEVVEPATGSAFDTGTLTRIVIVLFSVLGSIAVLWIILQSVWTLSLANASPVEKAYAKMSRLGAFAGISRKTNQTPMEYATALGTALPTISPSVQSVASAYTNNRYGKKDSDDDEVNTLDEAWKTMRGSLLARALRRLIPISGR